MTSSYSTVTAPGGLHAGVWQPDGEPVGTIVAIHGVTSSHLAFATVARALPEYRIIAPDLRGRGLSNTLGGPYGMAQHADDVKALLDHLGVEKALPVGHSMGAFVALVLADRHPKLAERLVLIDGGMPLELPAGVSSEQSIAAILGPAAERLSKTFPSREAYRDLWKAHPAFKDVWTADVEAYVDYDAQPAGDALKPATGYEALAEDTRDLGEVDGALIRAIKGLRVPAVLLQAERGMLDQPEGMYRDEYLGQWVSMVEQLSSRKVLGINHYTIVFAEPGVGEIVKAVKEGR